jgi:hypothetical protein
MVEQRKPAKVPLYVDSQPPHGIRLMGKASAETIQRCIEAQESMVIRRAFKFKLKPTKRQEAVFKRYTGAVCWVWSQRPLPESSGL